jgi:hypothetical protein
MAAVAACAAAVAAVDFGVVAAVDFGAGAVVVSGDLDFAMASDFAARDSGLAPSTASTEDTDITIRSSPILILIRTLIRLHTRIPAGIPTATPA